MKRTGKLLSSLAVGCVSLGSPQVGQASVSWSLTNSGVGSCTTGTATVYGSTANFGNVATCASAAALKDISAWANTGSDGTQTNGTYETARLKSYTGGWGVTNQDGTAGPGYGDSNEADTTPPEHGIDNNQRFELLLLSFKQDVELDSVTMGWANSNWAESDISVLRWVDGASMNPLTQLASKTSAGLLSTNGGGWEVVGGYGDLSSTKAVNALNKTSSYWLVGAYNSVFGNCPAGGCSNSTYSTSTSLDYVKISALAGVTPDTPLPPQGTAPAPGTLLLLGLGLPMLRRHLRRG